MNKPQSLFLSLIDFTSCGIPFLLLRTVQKKVIPITTRVFKQSRTRTERKNSIYTSKSFLSFCLSDVLSLGHPFCYPVLAGINLGPVVQSVVSLTSSLRVISLTVLADSIYIILIFFAEKMWVAFALQKLLTFFQQKISAYLRITQLKF